VSTYDAVIKKIVAESGVKVKEVNEYVKKGDTIISGSIYLNEEIKEVTKALGEIYGEVWYKISVEYPIINVDKKETVMTGYFVISGEGFVARATEENMHYLDESKGELQLEIMLTEKTCVDCVKK
jgi:hypothetical protein